MLTTADHIPTDFWGIVLPGWIGTIGGLLVSAVTVYTFIAHIRTRRGQRILTAAIGGMSPATVVSPAVGARTAAAATASGPWKIVDVAGESSLVNLAATSVTVVDIALLAGVRGESLTSVPLPAGVPPNSALGFSIRRTILSPTVHAIRVRWDEESSPRREVTLYF